MVMVTGTANSTMGPIKNELNDLSSSSWSDSNSRISTSPNLNVVTTTTSGGPNPMALDHHSGHTHSSQKKSASDTRRSNKPIMEKRRRARINNCLNELKNLLLDAMKKDPARHSKLEKADILEMTVKYLGSIQKQNQQQCQQNVPNAEYGLNKYRAGFNQCFSEVTRFPGLESETKTKLLHHLSASMNKIVSHPQPHSQSPPLQQLHQSQGPKEDIRPVQVHILPNSLQVPNNRPVEISQMIPNGIFVSNGVQLVPTRLSNGDIALLLPNNNQNMPAMKSSYVPVTASNGVSHVSNYSNSRLSPVSVLQTKTSPKCSVSINNNYMESMETSTSPLSLIVPKKADLVQSNNQGHQQHQHRQPEPLSPLWRPYK